MPEQKKFNTNQKSIRDIDINPPILFGKTEEGIKRLVPSSIITDSSKHNNQQITKGVYASGYRRIITLDSLSSNLKVFKLNSIFERIIVPQSQKDKEVIIMGFTYSEREQRIGATLKDVSLIFWDKQDSFQFQKCFTVSAFVSDYQTNIWYLNNTQQWITTDKSNAINIWDLEKEILKKQIVSKEITASINEIVEITHIKLVAVSSLDKKVTVWDLEKENIIFTIELGHAGIHHLLYSYQYQSLITSGFENSINVFSINPQYLDYDSVGKLIGHSSMVTAIQIIEKSPMIVSADDMGNIKIWDIRSLKCLQTINIGCKTSMTHIINVPDKNMICLLGTRVNFISFDNSHIQRGHEDVYPIKVEFNIMKQEMSVCTRKDMRFLRMRDGKITKIFTGLLQNSDDEIATCSSINQFKNFILGDHRGGLALYSYNNGEKIKDLEGHQSEVSQLKIDFPNKLIISSSWDSTIMLQRENNKGAEIKRIIRNAHFKKEVNQMEVSLYHNIIVTGSSGRKIFVWDYEFVKLIACIEIEKGTEPTGFSIINGYRLLIISTNSGMIYILKFNIKEFKAQFEVIGAFNIANYVNEDEKKNTVENFQTQGSDEYEEEKSEMQSSKYTQQIRRDSSANNTQTVHSNTSAANQNISNINRNAFPNNPHLSLQSNDSVQNSPANYTSNPSTFTKNQQSTFAQDKRKKGPNKPIPSHIKVGFQIQTNEKSLSQQATTEKFNMQTPSVGQLNKQSMFRQTNDSQFYNSDTFSKQQRKVSVSPKNNLDLSNDSSMYEADLPQEWPTKLLTEIQTDDDTKQLKNCLLYVATNKGNIIILNIDTFLLQEDIKLSEHITQRLNYNPLRQCAEDFYSQIEQIIKESAKIPQIVQQNKKFFVQKEKKIIKIRKFTAHRDLLTSFQFVDINNKCLLTSSLDQYVRIWTLKGELLGNLNINHPLPIKWAVMFDTHEKVKKKVFYALKILDIMLSKHKADSQLRKIMQIDSFINSLLPPSQQQIKLNLSSVKEYHQQSLQEQTKGVTFMRDEYSPRDLKYNEIKDLFEKELRGISLKQMEANKYSNLLNFKIKNNKKRLLLAQQQSEDHYQVPEIDIHAKRRKHEEHEMLQFLAPNWRNRLIQRQAENDHTKNVYLLSKKLDQKIRDKNRIQAKTRFSMMNQQGETITIQEDQQNTLQQSRNSYASNNMLNTPKLDKRANSKQSNKPTLSPRKMDDQTRSKQDLSSNQFISIIEKDETPNKKQKGSRINLQFNFDTTGSTVDHQQEKIQQEKVKEKKPLKKKNKNRYRSLDYLEYASEKNYLDESILHLSSVVSSQQNINTNMNTSIINNSVIKNNSTINNQQGNQIIPTDSVNTSIINQQSSIISKNANNSTTILATERSSLLSNSVSANNLQKAKVQLFMKNINSKLRQCRYQTDKVIFDKYGKQIDQQNKQNVNTETGNQTSNNDNTKNILSSIVTEALQEGDNILDNIEYKINIQKSQGQSNKINPISIIKPLQTQAKSILESLRQESLNSGAFTDRPSNYQSQKQFSLKLPQIQQAVMFKGENEYQLPSTIRSSRIKQNKYQSIM